MQTRFVNTDQPLKRENSLNRTKRSKIGFVLCAALAGALTGCVGYVDGPRGGVAYVEPPSVYVEGGVAVQPEYVYYPSYEVYYSSHTRRYIYRDGRSWVSRPAPPRVSAEVLFASPSVRLDFHDHPSNHHAAISREYPKHWAPPGQSRGRNQGHGKRDQD
jgi:hypothetical protein